jgi:MraZ protein
MATFSGTYECKMDAKGRVVLPARLKARLPDSSDQRIVILLGFQRCLTVYTMNEWEEKLKAFAEVSEYDEQGQQFIRNFTYGMSEETLDAQGRFSLNKTLISYAGLSGDVVMAGIGNRIEIWSAAEYQRTLTPLHERAGLQEIARGLFDNKKPATGAE